MFARIRAVSTSSAARATRARRRARRRSAPAHPRAPPTPPATRRPRARARARRPRAARPGASARARAGDARAPRCAGFRLCGIVDEPPPARLAHLAHLGLREQDDVERRSSPRAAGGARERGGELGDRGAARVPRDERLGEPELGGEAAPSTSGPRSPNAASVPGRAAELRRQRRDRSSASRASSRPASQPAAL